MSVEEKKTTKPLVQRGAKPFDVNPDWLAGFIDGGGCFLVNKAGYASVEITVGSLDTPVLKKLQHIYGGSVKSRAGSRSVRYRCVNKPCLELIVHAVNGRLRNIIRTQQLKKVCDLYGLTLQTPQPYSWDSAYASGLFDGNGTIVLSVQKHTAPKNEPGLSGKKSRLNHATSVVLTLSITQKYRENLSFLKSHMYLSCGGTKKQTSSFGRLCYDKRQNGRYTWDVTRRADVLQLCHYFDLYPCYGSRRHRIALVKAFYALVDGKLTPNSFQQKNNPFHQQLWRNFATDWFYYES